MIELKTAEEVKAAWAKAEGCWMSPDIPRRQYEMVVKNELVAYKNGAKIPPYDALIQCLFRIPDEFDSPDVKLLDVGASGAYYNEILKVAGFKYDYNAVDYNPDFKKLAEELYPGIKFDVMDASKMTAYHDKQFEIVVSGCCILHIKDYRGVVFEAARVAKDYVLFHRTPILHNKPTTYYLKEAYGIPCVEIHFSEREFMTLLEMAGLRLVHFERIFTVAEDGGYSHITYLTEKTK